jgi:hypothetical protein
MVAFQVCAITGREQTQRRACANVHKPKSLDDIVGCREQRRRHCEAERPGSLEIDDQLEFCRRLHREVGWFLAFNDNRSSVVNLSRPIALAPQKRYRSRPRSARRGGPAQVNSARRDVAEYNLERKRTSNVFGWLAAASPG